MKNTLDVTNSRVDIKEENISAFEFEDKMKQCEKGELKVERGITELGNNFTRPNMYVLGVYKKRGEQKTI